MRSRAFRRHQTSSHMMRRLKEDRNQHYDNLTCACYQPGKGMARFKEQPTTCSGPCCGNPRKWEKSGKLTLQERRFNDIQIAEEANQPEPLLLSGP